MALNVGALKKSEELALFLGMFVGDGCLTVNRNGNGFRIYPIRFYNTKKKLVKLFSNLFFKLFGVNGVMRSRDRKNKKTLWEFEKYSVDIYKAINNDFKIPSGKKASKVDIPNFILNGTKSIKKHFFLGILITDGSVRKRKDIMFHSSSEKLLYDLKTLIDDVWGFKRKIRHYTQRSKFKSYQLTLNKRQSEIVLASMPGSHNLVVR